jgi:hypothetical protein
MGEGVVEGVKELPEVVEAVVEAVHAGQAHNSL